MVQAIARAERILLLSARISATLLDYLNYILNKIRDQVWTVEPETSRWNTLELNEPQGTLVLTTAFPRYPACLMEKLGRLKACGFGIMAFTDSPLSPVLPLAENSIIVPLTQASIFDVYSTPFLLFNILLKDVAAVLMGIGLMACSAKTEGATPAPAEKAASGAEAAASGAETAASGEAEGKGVLKIGSDCTFAPFEYEENGAYTGFDI